MGWDCKPIYQFTEYHTTRGFKYTFFQNLSSRLSRNRYCFEYSFDMDVILDQPSDFKFNEIKVLPWLEDIALGKAVLTVKQTIHEPTRAIRLRNGLPNAFNVVISFKTSNKDLATMWKLTFG